MLKLRVLTGVSAVALATAFGVVGAKADNLQIDITPPGSITVAAGSSDQAIASEQYNTGALSSAQTINIILAAPNNTLASHDVNGGTDTVFVGDNEVFAVAEGNDVKNFQDFFLAENGGIAGANAASTLGSLQINELRDITSLVDNTDVQIDFIDLGPGSSSIVDNNSLSATSTANIGVNTIAGAVNILQNSTELGQATLTNGVPVIDAGATALVGNAQVNAGSDVTSLVSDSRVGLLVRTDEVEVTALTGQTLDVTDNTVDAESIGNTATNTVALTDGGAVSLVGTAGVANAQLNTGGVVSAEVRNVVIEAGNTQNYPTDEYMADLAGSDLVVVGNEITASATSNNATNSVDLDGISQIGVPSARLNNVSFAGIDTSNVNGDLFIASGQYTDVAVSATVDEGDFNVLVEDVTGSSVTADDNAAGAIANGSIVSNAIVVDDATVANELVAINSVQYNEGTQTASTDTLLTVTAAYTEGTTKDVVNSSISVEGNSAFGEATGNSQSSRIDVSATTIDGAGSLVLNPILLDRTAETGSVSADFSVLTAQVLDGGSAVANVLAAIDANAAADDFISSDLSVSTNDFLARAIGNLSTEASISLDGNTILASAGVVNSQTVEDDTQLTATLAPSGGNSAIITADAGGGDVTSSSIDVDSNTFDARVWGNLADATTNSIDVKGTTVSDAQLFQSATQVTRAASGLTFVALDSGYALVNDQSVEDLNGAVVTAQITGDLINVVVGGALVSDSDISADKNAATTSATLNQATNSIGIDATTLAASSGLVNVQTLADQDGVLGSAAILVDQQNLDITIDVFAIIGDIDSSTVTASENKELASARINLATNTVSVKAQTQEIDGVIDSASLNGVDSATLKDGSTHAQGETLLVNDQSFQDLADGGVLVQMFDNDITVNLRIGDQDLVSSTIEADKNAMNAIAAGNDAANTLTYDVANFDLSDGDIAGSATTNGPVATIANNQTGIGGGAQGTDGFSTLITSATIAVDADSGVAGTNDVISSSLSVDGNSVRALSRSNNVSNVLTASGNVAPNDAFDDPVIEVDGDNVLVERSTFAIASRQVNSVNIDSDVIGTAISVEAGSFTSGALDGSLTDSTLTANGNVVVAESRGNDAASTASINYVLNQAQATVVNVQQSGGGVSYTATVNATTISALSDADTTSGSTLTASGNAVGALASGNRANNVLNSGGTNVDFNNGDNESIYDPAGGPEIETDASLALVNVQGTLANAVLVSADVDNTLIGAVAAGDILDGSVTASNNLITAQATQHNASNTLNVTASANISSNGNDESPGASVVSLQLIGDGSVTSASIELAGIGAIADDVRTLGSVSMTATGNDIIASAVGGTANNTLRANAGASLNVGSNNDQSIVAGVVTTEAGFAVLNAQVADNATFTASVTNVGIAAGSLEDYLNDVVTVTDNLVQAEARGLVATNILELDAGAASDATAVLSNLQDQTSSDALATVTGVAILTGNIDEGATDSALLVGGNTVEALASGNKSTNLLESTAGAVMAANAGAGVTVDGDIDVTNSDYAILNAQSMDDSSVTASISFVGIGIDGLEATTGVNGSLLSVEGNEVLASAVGNETINQLVLNTGTFQHPTATISNLQTNTGTPVTASVDGVAIGIGGITTISAASTNSSLSVRGNSIGASAIGNSAVNIIRAGD